MDTIKIINTSYHKHMTDRHLAQVNFTASLPKAMFDEYIAKTSIDHQNLGRIRFMDIVMAQDTHVLVFGRVSHGYGYDIEQDITNAIKYSKGIQK